MVYDNNVALGYTVLNSQSSCTAYNNKFVIINIIKHGHDEKYNKESYLVFISNSKVLTFYSSPVGKSNMMNKIGYSGFFRFHIIK